MAALAGCTLVLPLVGSADGQAPRPNIVYIFADDLGKAGIGVHGQNARALQGLPAIKTPNLDALAAAGMTFDRGYAATVCSPSRGMLMTGFHQGHGHNDRNTQALRAQDITVAHLLSGANYATGVFGKWGYGGSGGTSTSSQEHSDLRRDPSINNITALPTTAGYDEFLGYLNHGRAHKYFVSSLWTTDPTGNPQTAGISEQLLGNQDPNDPNNNLHLAYTHDVVAARSEQFVADHYKDVDPFYMQVNYTIPHNDLRAIQFVPDWFAAYDDVDTSDWSPDEKYYAAMISRMDASVGTLLGRLDDPNGDGDTSDSVMDNTIVLFTSDNGATERDTLTIAGLDHFGINDLYRGGKRDLWEGGINVPFLVRWDGHVVPGSSSDLPTDLADFMATAADLAGVETPVGIDGVSIAPTLTGTGSQRDRGYLVFAHHENASGPDPDNRAADWTIIRGNEKLIRFANGDYELYNLASDPSEQAPLSLALPSNAALKNELEGLAIAEGVNQPDSYANEFQTWIGNHGDQLVDSSKWAGSTVGAPASNWSAVVNNIQVTESILTTGSTAGVLGLEVRGDGARQTIRVDQSQTLSGHNEVRVQAGGRIHMDGSTLASNRWIDIYEQAEVTGIGDVRGQLNNAGRLAPGLPDDLNSQAGGGGTVDTGIVDAVVFDFTGIQDNAPLTQTTVLSEHVQLIGGLNFGPGLTPRHPGGGSTDAGGEFNVQGYLNQTNFDSSLTDAIVAEDYLSFKVMPIEGLSMTLDTVQVNLWRNGAGAAEQYAILTSLDGFVATEAIGTVSAFDTGIDNQHQLTGQYQGGQATTGAVEIRIYGWDANGGSGNTHFNAVSMTASFTGMPLTPVAPVGALLLDGHFTQLETGILALELTGRDNTNPETPEYDTLHVVGDAVLDGELEIALGEDFIPSAGDVFDIVSIDGERSGGFASLSLPLLPPALSWQLDYQDHLVSLLVVPTLAGDFNADGVVDLSDYTIWRDRLGQMGRNLTADGNGDGTVDAADYQLWRNNFGVSLSAASTRAVPVPASRCLLWLALSVAGLIRLYGR